MSKDHSSEPSDNSGVKCFLPNKVDVFWLKKKKDIDVFTLIKVLEPNIS